MSTCGPARSASRHSGLSGCRSTTPARGMRVLGGLRSAGARLRRMSLPHRGSGLAAASGILESPRFPGRPLSPLRYGSDRDAPHERSRGRGAHAIAGHSRHARVCLDVTGARSPIGLEIHNQAGATAHIECPRIAKRHLHHPFMAISFVESATRIMTDLEGARPRV